MTATVLINLLRHEPHDVATVRRTAEARAAHPATTTKEAER